METEFSWQFLPNWNNAPIGPKDRGIEHYTGGRLGSLVRETIQNSLDAQAHPGETPAKVDFQLEELEVASFNGSQLTTALQASIAQLKSKDDAYRKMFRKAVGELSRETIPALVITDSGTTGVVENDEDDNPWAALIKGTGESNKTGNNSGGSYGIGKAAAYSVTNLRTVLYTTAFNSGGKLESRFIGKAILSGHKDPGGNPVTSEGFFGDGFSGLSNGDIPVSYRLGKPGLSLRIPGYKAIKSWQDDVIRFAIANFFHAIIKGELEVTVGEKTVTAETLDSFSTLLNSKEKFLLDTSRKQCGGQADATGYIDGIGTVNLYITLHEQLEEYIHEVALVRDAGMMITKIRGKLGPANFNIPGHWNRFTAIVECISDPEGKSAVRDAESPKHDELDLDRIPNEEDRAPARKALRDLGQWIREEIRKYAEPASNLEPVNATEAAAMLPIPQGNTDPNQKYLPNGDSISTPVQRGTSTPTRNVVPGPPKRRKGKPRKPPGGQNPPIHQPLVPLAAFSRAKFRLGGRHDTHGLTIEIPPFNRRIDNVQIQAVTEHGGDIALKITHAWRNGKPLKISNQKITAIAPDAKNPVILEVNLQEPVNGRRFRLHNAKDRKQSE